MNDGLGRYVVLLTLFAAALACVGVGGAPVRGDQPAAAGPVREVHNIAYCQGNQADPIRHRLDLYLPDGKRDYPVLVLVHGGAWMLGDKSLFGWGPAIGRHFASRGIGVVMPSYRLSPGVRHPEHVRDVARAVAWAAAHVADYGGSSSKLFLCGHSAGGHLVALLATDPTYLKAEGLPLALIRGVIAVSGVYRVPVLDLGFTMPGLTGGTLRALAGLFTAPTPEPAQWPEAAPTVSIPVNLFSTVFGTDRKECAAASPVTHVTAGLPPFLLINAEKDLPLLPEMARDFAGALRGANDEVQEMTIKGRGHEDVMFRASSADDPVARAIERFVRRHLKTPAAAAPVTP
jgi:acetyl esterase/lipase